MTTADTGTPLCTWAQFTQGAFRDLARSYTDSAMQQDYLMEATRLCEAAAGGRRLAPFTNLTETHRLGGIDPDEYVDSANLPLDLQGTAGRSYAYALGVSTLVRHVWLNQYATRFPELWAYTGTITVNITRSYGGGESLQPGQYKGPDVDTGHIWFNLGKFIPVGSYADITYSGGYQTTPSDLRRACKLMLASIIIRELQPNATERDPELLQDEAEKICAHYQPE